MYKRYGFRSSLIKSLVYIPCLCITLLTGCVTTTTGPIYHPDPEKSLESNIQLGIGYIRNGEYDRAKEKLSKALEIDSKSAEVHNAFGLLFQVQGEYVMAEAHYKKAIRFDSDLAQARNNYGAFLFSQQRYKAAIKQLEKASEDTLYRARSQVFENLGRCYLAVGDLEQGESALTRAVGLNPRQPRALLELAMLHFDRRDFTTSGSYYDRHIQVSRQTARSLWLGIRLARVFDKHDDEASYSLMLKNIFPASNEFKQYMATMP
jgi:type IV pilus assembly protein PilF